MVKFFIATVVPLTVIIPIVIGIVHLKKFPFYLKVIVAFTLASGITSGACIFLAKRGINNMPVFHAFTIAGFILCSIFYKQVLTSTKVEKAIFPVLFLFLVFATTSTILWQGLSVFNSYTLTFETIVTIVYCLMLFYKLLGADSSSLKENGPLIWINTGFLLYFSGSLFLFLFPQFLTAPQWVYEIGWIIHAILVLLMYTFFSIAFIKYRAPK
jgi:hypothetical protein